METTVSMFRARSVLMEESVSLTATNASVSTDLKAIDAKMLRVQCPVKMVDDASVRNDALVYMATLLQIAHQSAILRVTTAAFVWHLQNASASRGTLEIRAKQLSAKMGARMEVVAFCLTNAHVHLATLELNVTHPFVHLPVKMAEFA